jgi:hypothetical protein
MARAAAIVDRLPPLYREGELVGGLVDVIGLQHEIVDEELFEIQRAHWFGTCLELDEAAALAAVLDIAPEPWQSLAEFRPWVHALRDARSDGSVTPSAVTKFVERYTAGYEAANRVALVSSPTPRLIENPSALLIHRQGPLEPLQRFVVTNRGLDPAPLAAVLTALGTTGPEYAPMLANVTTGEVIVYRGAVPGGQRLTLRPDEAGPRADLEGVDVTDRLRFEGDRPITLAHGENELWFLPLAHFDTPGLDRFLLALAGDDLRQGRWTETAFDRSLFYQDPAIVLTVAWAETTPAAFRVDLATEVMTSSPDGADDALVARDELVAALDGALARLAAAGVRSAVTARAHHESQPAGDRLRMVLPLTHREVGPTGADRLPEAGGVFDVTAFDDSTMR